MTNFSEYSVISRAAHDSLSRRVFKENSLALAKFQRWRKSQRKERGLQGGERSPVSCSQDLVPGIPDEVTINEIVPKLPWIALHVLSAVSRSWNIAIRTRQVYDTRVRAQSTEPLDVYIDVPGLPKEEERSLNFRELSRLFICSSMDKKSLWCVIPPLPGVQSGLPYRCGVLPIDGKIYVVGGVQTHTHCDCLHLGRKKIVVRISGPTSEEIWRESRISARGPGYHVTKDGKTHSYENFHGRNNIHCPCGHPGSEKVFMLDMAAQIMKWTQCASMLVPRQFSYGGCRVKDGKIHVYGGLAWKYSHKIESEVYDPKTDSWSAIQHH